MRPGGPRLATRVHACSRLRASARRYPCGVTQTPDPAATTHRPGARRRLRRAVRAADRAPRARGQRVLRDRAAHRVRRGPAGQGPGRDHPVRRAVVGVRRRAPRSSTRRCSRPACRCSASATASRRWPRRSAGRSRRPACASTAARRSRSPSAGTVLSGSPASQTVWMSHGDAVHAAPEGFTVLATSSGSPVAAFEDRARRLYGVQWHPEVKHSTLGQQVLENFLYEGAGLTPDWNAGNVIAEQVEKIRAQVGDGAGDLRAVRRRRLRGRRRARAEGRRRPADLRVRRPRPAAVRRGRAGRAGLRRRDRRAARRSSTRASGSCGRSPGSPTPRPSARSSAASSSGCSRTRRARWSRRPASGEDGPVPRPGHAVPGRRRVRRRRGRGQHQEPPQRRRAARTTCSSSWSSRCARCSRTRSARSAWSSACPRRSSGASRSPAPAWASGSSAR